MRLKKLSLLFLPLALIALIPSTFVLACAVCFGGADSNLVRGFTWGIWILLILPFVLAAGLVALVAANMKKPDSAPFPTEPDHV